MDGAAGLSNWSSIRQRSSQAALPQALPLYLWRSAKGRPVVGLRPLKMLRRLTCSRMAAAAHRGAGMWLAGKAGPHAAIRSGNVRVPVGECRSGRDRVMQRLVNVAGLQVHHGAGFEVANEKDPVRWRLVGVLGSSPTLALVGGFLHDPAGKVMQLGAVEQLLCIQCPGSPVVELCDLRARDVERMAQ